MNIINGVFLVAYVLSALVQVNDPDPLFWITVYALAAAMCAAQYRRNPPRWLPILLLSSSLVYMASLIPAIAGEVHWSEIFASVTMQTRAVEEAREIGGLLLVASWSAVLAYHNARSRSAART